MKFFVLIPLLFFIPGYAQKDNIYQNLADQYMNFQYQEIQTKRFNHEDLTEAISGLKHEIFQVDTLGFSMEKKPIFQIKIGNGPVKILLWSQMHGNESTATMTILDLFNFLSRSDEFDELKNTILSKTTLYFIPMLNPDGANRFMRRNSLGIDINRDALRLQTPEGRILKETRDDLNPDWAFNLHDQGAYYGAGNQPYTASFSFLAPAFDEVKSSSPKRDDAMKLIVSMWKLLQDYIPGYVGRYNDTFEPRAFGDNMQKWGSRTILIETGAYHNDREKQYLRQLHFLILIQALADIASQNYENYSTADYEKIPFNRSAAFHDLIIRNVERHFLGDTFQIDISFRNLEIEIPAIDSFYLRSSISDIGDLSVYFAYQDFDASEYVVEVGKMYPEAINIDQFKQLKLATLLEKGFTTFLLKNGDQLDAFRKLNLPLNFITDPENYVDEILPGLNPTLLLLKDQKVTFMVINGQLYALDTLIRPQY